MVRLDIESLDRRLKWGLLAVSLLTLALLAGAAVRENFLAPWRVIRGRYAGILESKAVDDRGRALAAQFENHIVQNVLPELETVDRCITCHPGIDDPRMTEEPNPYRVHPGEYLIHHPPDKFGCTICHRGQGRALVFAEAKAEGYHWDYPLLPVELTESSCGVCHAAAELADQGGADFVRGKELFAARGCAACHQLHGRGGSLGPALDSIGLKVKGMLPMAHIEGPHTLPQWLQEHFDDPQRAVPGSQMKPPHLTPAENRALTVYMLSLQDRDLPRTYLSPGRHLEYYKRAFPEPRTAEDLFAEYCTACHDSGNFGPYDSFFGKFIPAVRGPSLARTATIEYLEAMIREGRPGTLMPAWGPESGGLSSEEISKLAAYLKGGAETGGEQRPANVMAERQLPDQAFLGQAARGAALFAKHCTACHGPMGEGVLAPSLSNRVLQQNATDEFLFVTIAIGRRNTVMPGFLAPGEGGMSAEDIKDLVAHVRALGGVQSGESRRAEVTPESTEEPPHEG